MLILPLSLTLLIPTLICGVLAWIIWSGRPREGDDPTASNLLITIVLGCAVGTAAYAIELIVPDIATKLVLIVLWYIGTLTLMTASLLFAIWYAGKWSWVTPAKVAALSAGPVLILIAVTTNSVHHLYYTDVWLDASYEIPQLVHTAGPLYVIAGAYFIVSFAASLVILMSARFTIHRGHGSAWPALIVGIVVPLIAYILYLAGLRPFGFLDLVPYSITVSAVALTLATLRFHILDLRPVARETLIRDLPTGMVVFDNVMRIIDINPAAARLLGFGQKPVLNRATGEVFPPEDPVLRFCLTRCPGNTEVERAGRSLEVTLALVPGHLTETIGYLLILQDITEKRQALDAQRLANRKLKMLSNITRHDIKNQLTALRGYQHIVRESIQDPVLTAMVAREIDAAERINDLIQFTKEYEDIGEGEPRWFTISSLILPATTFAGQHHIDLIIDAGSWEIYVDPLIPKVIFNLVENAIRHGVNVTKIRFSSEQESDVLLLVWEDDGIGVAAEMKDRIFMQGVGENTGLGLFYVREILSITGLSIAETGRPGAGARFEIRVPPGKFRKSSELDRIRN